MQKADFEGMSRKDLLDLARERGVPGRTKMDRDGLIEALTGQNRSAGDRSEREPAPPEPDPRAVSTTPPVPGRSAPAREHTAPSDSHGEDEDDRWNRVSSQDPNYGRFLKKDGQPPRPGWRPPAGRPSRPGREETLAERSERGRDRASERAHSARDSLRRTGEARHGVPYVPHYLRRGNEDPTQRQPGNPPREDRNERHRRDRDRGHPGRRDGRGDRDGARRDPQGGNGGGGRRGSQRHPRGRHERGQDRTGRPRQDRETRDPNPLRFQGRTPADRPWRNPHEENRSPNVPGVPNGPNAPDRSNVPNGPNIPIRPQVPTAPNVPNRPNVPNGPNVSNWPNVPNGPSVSDRPDLPNGPNVPEGAGSSLASGRVPDPPRRDEGRAHGRGPRHQRRRESERPYENLGMIGPVAPGELERELAAMRRTESETAVPGPEANPPAKMDDGGDPNTDRCRAMARDPYWIHAYWNISAATLARARRELGGGGRRVLRVHSSPLEHRRASSTQPAGFFDIEVGDEPNNWYIHVGIPERAYRVDVGLLGDNGLFYPLASSNRVTTPLDRMSDRVDPSFPLPSEEAQELYKLSGGSPVPQISHDPPSRANAEGVRVDWPRDAKPREGRTETGAAPAAKPGPDADDPEPGGAGTGVVKPHAHSAGEGRASTGETRTLTGEDRATAGGNSISAGGSTASGENGDAVGENGVSASGNRAGLAALPAGAPNETASTPRGHASSPHGQRPWSETIAAPHGVEPSPQGASGFWFVLHTELVVSGATEPNATVTIQGVPVRLRPDGTFTVRFQLPDGEQTIPVVATSREGAVRSVTARVRRETSRFEKNPAGSGGETGPHGEASSHGEDHGLDTFE